MLVDEGSRADRRRGGEYKISPLINRPVPVTTVPSKWSSGSDMFRRVARSNWRKNNRNRNSKQPLYAWKYQTAGDYSRAFLAVHHPTWWRAGTIDVRSKGPILLGDAPVSVKLYLVKSKR